MTSSDQYGAQTAAEGPSTVDEIVAAFTANWALCTRVWGASVGARSVVEDAFVATTADRPAFVVNSAVLLRPLEPDEVPGALAALDDFYGFSRGTRPGRVLLFSGWDTPDLTSYGWDTVIHPPLMHLPAGARTGDVPPGLDVEPVRDDEALRGAEQVTVEAFRQTDLGSQPPGSLFGSTLLAEPRMPMWVGREGDRVVSTAATFVSHGVNDIVNVATAVGARGRGYAPAVTWRAALANPALPAVLVASDLGAPVYERMGFTTVRRITAWARTPSV
jgi:hypothetical protein